MRKRAQGSFGGLKVVVSGGPEETPGGGRLRGGGSGCWTKLFQMTNFVQYHFSVRILIDFISIITWV